MSLARETTLEVGMRATDKDGCFVSGSGCGSWFVRPLSPVCAFFDAVTPFETVVKVLPVDGIDLGEVTRGASN